MAIRLEKSGELMLIRGIPDEMDDQAEWNTRRRKLGAFMVAVAVGTAAVFIAPHVPGFEMISDAFKSVMAVIW